MHSLPAQESIVLPQGTWSEDSLSVLKTRDGNSWPKWAVTVTRKFSWTSAAQEGSDESNPPLPKVTSKPHAASLEINPVQALWSPSHEQHMVSTKVCHSDFFPREAGGQGPAATPSGPLWYFHPGLTLPGCSQLMTKHSRIYWTQDTCPLGPLQWATLAPEFPLRWRGFLITLPPSIFHPSLLYLS